MWPHSCAVSRTLGALQGRKLRLIVLSHRDSHRIGVQRESGKRAAWVKGLVGRWMDGWRDRWRDKQRGWLERQISG